MVVGATGLLELSDHNHLAESGVFSDPVTAAAQSVFPRDLLGSMQKPRSRKRLRGVVGLSGNLPSHQK
jgi:hypothetical protein